MREYPQRDAVVSYLRSILEGPVGGEFEEVKGTPLLRYMVGMLFPVGADIDRAADQVTASAVESTGDASRGNEEDSVEASIELASEALTSAVGMSFRVPDDAVVRCEVRAARYEEIDSGARGDKRGARAWVRRPLGEVGRPTRIDVTKSNSLSQTLWDGRARLVPQWRSGNDGNAIVTIALVNATKATRREPRPADVLYQVGLRCIAVDSEILPYPEVVTTHETGSEEREIDFLYRKVKPFARGHGAAANWGTDEEGRCHWVEVDFLPKVEVPAASFEVAASGIDDRYSSLDFLVNEPRSEVLEALTTLTDSYQAWIAKQALSVTEVDQSDVSSSLVARAEEWMRRMRLGIGILKTNDLAWRCFRLANRAMAMQMVLAKARPKIPFNRLERRKRPPFDFAGKSWRPFQIAFLLASLEPLVNQESPDRDLVDVIWFPTGGGKTEAYLLVSAFELVRRRLVYGDRDTGTAVISRYTLRFLTAQQFQRTAALIVALELVRRESGQELGTREFSLGLWVGRDVTANRYRVAHQKMMEQREARVPKNPFLLQACPCCGTDIFPSRPPSGKKGWRDEDFGVVAALGDFRFYCPNVDCEFHSRLPLDVVDEALYARPASLLLGTIDKFAQLPWDDRSRVFFGGVDDRSPPPSLVLQDELHLISGPLGSLAAPYDAAIDTIIRLRGGHAKRIASTATIRNAAEQVRGLYGRRAAVFPAPCGSWDSAFFFSTDTGKPGRAYVGAMGQGYVKPVVAMAWTSAALLQSVREVPLDADALNAYWTLLAYHNSRRELGRTLTAARDEVQSRIKAIASSPALVRDLGEPLELSAQMVKSLGEAIEALEQPYSSAGPPVDLVPCTSIISVGVDLDRLGLMLVNGQPKLTSEYIQATSRVGRGVVPGLVVSLFSATKPRDRSHYEDFRAYHEAIYRHVEPTSVTPYALPARERTLHAALISVIRHATQYQKNDTARAVDFDNPLVKKAIAELTGIMCASDPTEASAIKRLADERIQEWREAAESGVALLFERRYAGFQFVSLLAEYGKSQVGAFWPTMTSVRNVDAEARVRVE